MNLQLALDFTNLKSALIVANKVAEYVDIIEAGTPLIKAEGLRVVSKLKAHFPNKLIAADLKTADVGGLEVRLAAEAGADMCTVLAAAPLETVRSSIEKAWQLGNIKVAVDFIGVEDVKKKIRQIRKLKPDYFLIHTGIDEQRGGKDPLQNVKLISKITQAPLIVAGGLNEQLARNLVKIENIDILVFGGAITRAASPVAAAMKIREVLQEAEITSATNI